MLIIDGHNLIGRTPGLSLEREEEAREAVLRRVEAWRGRRGGVVVVFDGDRPGTAREERFGGLRVVYSGAGRSADDEIVRLLGAGNPRDATVVTSDRRLGRRAAELGARVETSDAFSGRLGRSPRPAPEKPVPAEDDVELWLRTFRAAKGRHNP